MNTKIEKIREEIKTKQNGPASESMDRMGLKYKKNFGVSITELKLIAEKYKNDHELSKQLRNSEIREFKLLGIMTEDPLKVSDDTINEIVNEISNIETAQQTCINLLEKIPFCYKKAFDWISRNEPYVKITGYLLFSRIAQKDQKFDNALFLKAVEYAPNDFEHENYQVRMSLAKALRNIALRNQSLKRAVLEKVEKLNEINSPLSAIIYEETVELLK